MSSRYSRSSGKLSADNSYFGRRQPTRKMGRSFNVTILQDLWRSLVGCISGYSRRTILRSAAERIREKRLQIRRSDVPYAFPREIQKLSADNSDLACGRFHAPGAKSTTVRSYGIHQGVDLAALRHSPRFHANAARFGAFLWLERCCLRASFCARLRSKTSVELPGRISGDLSSRGP